LVTRTNEGDADAREAALAPRRLRQGRLAELPNGNSYLGIFFSRLPITASQKRLSIEEHTGGHSAGAMCWQRRRAAAISENRRENAPEMLEGFDLTRSWRGIMTMSEYEERFRSPTRSLHQTLAESRGPNRGRRRRRPFLVAVALVGVMSMTMKVTSHHTTHSGASNGSQLCESNVR
jgi:hypothetical protein